MVEFRENKDVRRPFLSAPDPRVYFPASIIEKARRDASRCLKRGEGVALIVGDAGVGKTLLARKLAADLDADDLVAVVAASRKFTVKAFLQQLLFAFRQSFVGGDETELRLMALDYLERAPQQRRVLLIDDAQNLSLRVFDEIRMLVDHMEPPTQLTVALLGTPELEERLNLPVLYPFAQRIAMRAWLDPFTNEETGKFIAHELKRAELNAKFTKAAKKLVAELSVGAPRVVVQLCDRALFLATEEANSTRDGKKTKTIEIDEEGVREAWRNLQSIETEPTTSRASTPEEGAGIIEFGELDDDDSDVYDETVAAVNDVRELAPSTPETAETTTKNAAETSQPDVTEERPEQTKGSSFAEGFARPLTNQPPEPLTVDDATSAESVSAEEREHAERRRVAREGFWSQEEEGRPLLDANSDLAPVDEPEDTDEEYEIDASIEERLLAALDAKAKESSRETVDDAESFSPVDEPEEFGDAIEIDPALEARILANLDATSRRNVEPTDPIDALDELVGDLHDDVYNPTKTEPMNFELVTKDGESYTATCAGIADASFVGANGETGDCRSIPDLWEQGGVFDEALSLNASTTPTYSSRKSVTREPLTDTDDGSNAYKEANGFTPEEASLFDPDAPILETRTNTRQNDSHAPEWNALHDELELADDHHGYRQFVESCYRSSSDFNASDDYLHELSLLEQEIAEEANLVRRIRRIHLQLRAVRDRNATSASLNDDDPHNAQGRYRAK